MLESFGSVPQQPQLGTHEAVVTSAVIVGVRVRNRPRSTDHQRILRLMAVGPPWQQIEVVEPRRIHPCIEASSNVVQVRHSEHRTTALPPVQNVAQRRQMLWPLRTNAR